MRKPYEKILRSVQSTLLSPFEEGMSPEQIKQTVIYILTPYFTNLEILHELAAGVLVTEAVNVAKINNDPWARDMFAKVLCSYQTAYTSHKELCLQGCAESQDKILHASSEYVSMLNFSNDLTALAELSIEDFSYTVFRNIGSLIEACFQPYLKELLLQIRICRGKSNSAHGLEKLKLGSVVDELFNTSGYGELFAPSPWHIKLHQWRNISQHHNTFISESKINVNYEVSGSQRSTSFTREELLDAFKKTHLIFSVLRGVRSIFIWNNVQEFEPFFSQETSIRSDVKIFWLASSLATQGFELKDISVSDELVVAVIKDVTDTPSNEDIKNYKLKRMIHSTQLIYSIWFYFPAATIVVEHLDKQDNIRSKFSGRGSACEAISREEVPLEELIKGLIFCTGRTIG
ncbi:MAG: hypothetical protein KME16_26565 [Scytolyngbya sp. HA4215-MV1]|nr:hypothetical protein [Scytolyngbya sp. HA4215-MV1]